MTGSHATNRPYLPSLHRAGFWRGRRRRGEPGLLPCLSGTWASRRPGRDQKSSLAGGLYRRRRSGVRPMERGRFALCWWARFMVESTDTVQSISPAASTSARSLARIRAHVPSEAKRRCRVQIICHGPNSAGRSRQAMPHRYRQSCLERPGDGPGRPSTPRVRTRKQRPDPGPLILTKKRSSRHSSSLPGSRPPI